MADQQEPVVNPIAASVAPPTPATLLTPTTSPFSEVSEEELSPALPPLELPGFLIEGHPELAGIDKQIRDLIKKLESDKTLQLEEIEDRQQRVADISNQLAVLRPLARQLDKVK